jgi:tetratricopeptide (TPR) repeat protein
MRIALDTRLKRNGFLAGLCLFLVLYFTAVTREFVGDYLASLPGLRTLRAAAWLWVPENADYHYRLGRYYDLVARDQEAAIKQYMLAVRLNPHDSHYWLGLANIYQAIGDTANQSRAIESGVAVDPTTPDLAWEAANLYISQGETEKALREFHVVMESGPEKVGLAMQLCWRINPDVDVLLRQVVPARLDSYFAFLSFLVSKQDTEGTLKVWDALVQLRQPIEIDRVFDYVRYLLLQKDADDAPLVWRQATSLVGLGAYLPSSTNLIVNPSFNLDVLNGGFDWQYRKQSSVSLTLDTNETHDGHRSLGISFDGPGVSDAGIYQVIAVRPNTTYLFSGNYKNGQIDGAGGPHFALQDLYTANTYFLSPELKDAPDWKEVSGELTTGSDTKILVLRVQRLPSGSPIRGKLWIDDFRLSEKPADTKPS